LLAKTDDAVGLLDCGVCIDCKYRFLRINPA